MIRIPPVTKDHYYSADYRLHSVSALIENIVSEILPVALNQNLEFSLECLENSERCSLFRATAVKSPAQMPFFIKCLHGNQVSALTRNGNREIEFYSRVDTRPCSVIPQCLYAAYNPDLDYAIIVLPDLSSSHHKWSGIPGKPSSFTLTHIIDSLINLHTTYWNKCSRLVQFVSAPYELNLLLQPKKVEAILKRFSRFAASQGVVESLGAYELECLEGRLTYDDLATLCNAEALCPSTLLHNDPHECNFLYPHIDRESSFVIDWETWGWGPCTNDLAYFLVLCQTSDYRQTNEIEVLTYYHRRVCEMGVNDYPWQSFLLDYRWSVHRCLYVVIMYWWRLQIEQARILRGLERALKANEVWTHGHPIANITMW